MNNRTVNSAARLRTFELELIYKHRLIVIVIIMQVSHGGYSPYIFSRVFTHVNDPIVLFYYHPMHLARQSTFAQGFVLVDSQVPLFHQLGWYCNTSVALAPPFPTTTARTLIALLYMQCPSVRRSTERSSRPLVHYGFLDGR